MTEAPLVKRCPACGTEHPPAALRCGCGVLLAGVDLSAPAGSARAVPPSVPRTGATADTADAAVMAAKVCCPHSDCLQLNPAGRDRCLYCDRPLRPVAPRYAILWPWGARTPVGEEMIVGRVPPAPGELVEELNRSYDNVSRRHARLRVDGGVLTLEDLNSANGTFVDGVRILSSAPVRLAAGAALRFAADLEALVATVEEEEGADGR